jgi:hypothetical protein
VAKALERDPAERYQSCREMQRALESLIHQSTLPIGTQEIARLVADLQAEPDWGKLPAGAPPPATIDPPRRSQPHEITTDSYPAPPRPKDEPTDPRPPPARPRRSPMPIVAAAAVVVIGLAVGTVRALSGGPPAPQPAPPVAPRVEAPAAAVPDAGAAAELSRSAYLTVESIPKANIRIGQRVHRSPWAGEVEPGEVQIEVSDQEKGFTRKESITLAPGERRKVTVSKVKVTFRAGLVDAKVFVDGRPIRDADTGRDLTPIKTELWEGWYTVRFECPDGAVNQQVQVSASKTKVTGCEQH